MEHAEIFEDRQQAARLRAEAEFGWREIQPYFAGQQKPNTVLEVGCGTGYLLSQMAQKFNDISFTGVEPIGSGFTQFESTLNTIEKEFANITFVRKRIEDIKSEKRYDLIYSINVFEHLDDWREAIDICMSLLNSNGLLVILCPNYWIPYESHFSLPVIGNKSLTYKVFSKRITEMEERLRAQGLWKSLNFVTVPQIQRYCKVKGYTPEFDTAIMARMLDRLDDDPEFKKRQSSLARLASIANQLGAGFVLRLLPPRWGAYMKVTFRAQNQQNLV
ncbi:class I SAM-dependent methyltransferase [Sneathiella litorea]|uniref:Methyltransferase domain-containing protein n=1 Tax=Sneathiella litorea TaxID=2606216 RepID=A0A6L8W667_9PROT|nr:class I SAM-dependent methyltransferase [Sneathiella litorea]MZR30636.1 methyltransferase domain-containing protein [Sneathiella litorea]